MARTPSTMLPLGTTAPEFSLLEPLSNKSRTLTELKSERATVVMFICNHCPYVIHSIEKIVHIANNYQSKNISFIAINSNDTDTYPQDSPENMITFSAEYHLPFPYLFDETQNIAKAYQAACTPDFFIFDTDLKLVYRGQMDDARPGNNLPVTGKDLQAALEKILQQKAISPNQKPSLGCNIKWK
jgi:thiol-disulfide isomerase/thioredoxin